MARTLTVLVALLLNLSSTRGGVELNTVTDFGGTGGTPQATLSPYIVVPSVDFCGTTTVSTYPSGYGTIFSLSWGPGPWYQPNVTSIHNFAATEGGDPVAAPIGPGILLYGTTANRALSNSLFSAGMGSVYKTTTNGTLTVLYRFGTRTNTAGQPLDGASPHTPLVLSRDANADYYGTTYYGGSNGYANGGLGFGTIFLISPSGVLTTVHSFSGTDGAFPNGMMRGVDGNYYGATACGGSNTTPANFSTNPGYGTVFKLTSNGVFSVLYSFGNVTNASGNALDGWDPQPLLQGSDGALYGVSTYGGTNVAPVNTNGYAGCGTVFKVATNGGFSLLYSFGAVSNTNGFILDGYNPVSTLCLGADGSFFGVTKLGGLYTNGTVFKVNTNGLLATLHSFGAVFVREPPGPPSGTFQSEDGSFPEAGLVLASDNNFYGTTSSGGNGPGTLFQLAPGLPYEPFFPASAAVASGTSNTFLIGVDSLYPLSFQWRFHGTNLVDNFHISGSTTSNLTILGVTAADAGIYSVGVTNLLGGLTNTVTLSVTNPPPVVQSFSFSQPGGMLTFTWSAISGQTYQIQYTTDLTLATWLNLSPSFVATNGVMSSSDWLTNTQSFYRVVLLP
jgi:uncharacterized repeat protein (TIGR03803 family)